MQSEKENVFEQLTNETQSLQENIDMLQNAFETLAKSNGSAEPIRKRLKSRLSKPAFIESLQAR